MSVTLMVERRLYFVVGDLVSTAAAGVVITLVMAGLVTEGWPMMLAMAAGMVLGGVLAVPISLLASTLFGAFEIMLPVMMTGMVAGMAGSMLAVRGPVSVESAAGIGLVSALVVLAATYALNASIRAKGTLWTS